MKKRILAILAALMAVGTLTVSSAPQASALTGDYIFNCGERDNCLTGYYITVLKKDNFQYAVAPGHGSPNSIQAFWVPTCFYALNVNTGYKYTKPGWTYFSVPNAFISLSIQYQGWC